MYGRTSLGKLQENKSLLEKANEQRKLKDGKNSTAMAKIIEENDEVPFQAEIKGMTETEVGKSGISAEQISSSEESDEEDQNKRRYLLGKHSFLRLKNPGLENALDPEDQSQLVAQNTNESGGEGELVDQQAQINDYIRTCQDMGIRPFQHFIRYMHTEKLDLDRYGLGEYDIIAICNALEKNNTIVWLSFAGNYGGKKGGEAIAKMIEANQVIKYLDISAMKIAPAMNDIGLALTKNSAIESLNLSKNELGNREIYFLERYISESSGLKELYLSRNGIEDFGLTSIGRALKKNTELIILDVGWNYIRGSKVVEIFFYNCANHPTLTRLSIFGNSFPDERADSIANLLAKNKQLDFLDISWNRFDKKGSAIISKGFSKNKSLANFIVGPNRWRQLEACNFLNPLLSKKNNLELKLLDFGYILDVHKQYLALEKRVLNLRSHKQLETIKEEEGTIESEVQSLVLEDKGNESIAQVQGQKNQDESSLAEIKNVEPAELKIVRGQPYGFYNPKAPNLQDIVIRRAHVVCESFETPLSCLVEELSIEPPVLTRVKFRKFIKSCNLYKDKALTQSFMENFKKGALDVDCLAIIAAFDRVYPGVRKERVVEVETKSQGKGKKKKKSKSLKSSKSKSKKSKKKQKSKPKPSTKNPKLKVKKSAQAK